MAMEGAEQPSKAYWASTIHPAIKDDFERLLNTTPTRIAQREKEKKEKEEKKGKEAKKEKKEEDETD